MKDLFDIIIGDETNIDNMQEMNRLENRLKNLGFSDRIYKIADLYPGLYLGRIIGQNKELYKVATNKGEVIGEISGKMRHMATTMTDYPTVGDFVLIDRVDQSHGNAIIHQIVTRKSLIVRKAAGTSHEIQIVAANIDTIFICMSLNNDFNIRRLERYMAISFDSGAMPVIVLAKVDICDDLSAKLAEVEKVAVGVDIIITSGLSNDGYQDILQYIVPGQTVAFIGSSGVGKSTLINRLLGEEIQETKEIRKDDKGRHATTSRELKLIPTGGAVIDTPGMRELGLESVNLSKAFVDIEQFASQCKFKDCHHENEPGCRVKKAIEDGELDDERLISYKKLKKEAKYEGLNSKQIEKEKIDQMFSQFGGIKNARDFAKGKNKNK